MKSRLEEDPGHGEIEGLILDKFLVDAFKPKICHEKDVMVLAFLARQRNSAEELNNFISRGPFSFINVESSASPDQDGNYIVLVEMDRSREMFMNINNLLSYVNQQVHISEWYFKPSTSEKFISWNEENFRRSVPQHPEEFLSRKKDVSVSGQIITDKTAGGESAKETPEAPQAKPAPETAGINYRLLAKIIDRQVTKSSRNYIREFQKQFKRVIKNNRRMLKHFENIKSDQKYLFMQLEMHQKRERLALLRERQDIKRIRSLEDRLSYFMIAHSKNHDDAAAESRPATITINSTEASVAPVDAEDIYDAETQVIDPQEVTDETGSQTVDSDGTVENIELPEEATEASSEIDVQDKEQEQEQKQEPEPKRPSRPATQADPVKIFESDSSGIEELEPAFEPAVPIEESSGPISIPPIPTEEPDQNETGVAAEATGTADEARTTSATAGGRPDTDETGPKSDPASQYFARAIAASEQKEYHKAIEYFTRITELSPDEPRSYYNLAILYYRLKDYDTAHEYATRADDLGAKAARRIITRVETKKSTRDEVPIAVPEEVASEEISESAIKESLPAADDSKPKDGIESDTDAKQSVAAETTEVESASAESTEIVEVETIEVSPVQETIDAIDTAAIQEFPAFTGVNNDTIVIDSEALDEINAVEIDEIPGVGAVPVEDTEVEMGKENLFEPPADQEEAPDTEQPPAVEKSKQEPGRAETEKVKASVETEPPVGGDEMPPVPDKVQPIDETSAIKAPVPETETDYFALAMEASYHKNYKRAIDHFTKYIERFPDEPRGYYNLAVLYYRLKDYAGARESAGRARDLGVNAAERILQKVDEKLAIKVPKPAGAAQTDRSGSIIEDDTTVFEMADVGAPEYIDTKADQPEPPPTVNTAPQVLPNGPAEASEASEQEPKEAALAETGQHAKRPDELPEFPSLTGEIAQTDGNGADVGKTDDSGEDIHPLIEAIPLDGEDTGQLEENVFEPTSTGVKTAEVQPPVVEHKPEIMPDPEVRPVKSGPSKAQKKLKSPPPKIRPEKSGTEPEASKSDPAGEHFALGMAAFKNKKYKKAIAHFTEFIEMAPQEPRGYYNLAILYYRLRDYDAAEANAKRALGSGAKPARQILEKVKKKRAAAAKKAAPVKAVRKTGSGTKAKAKTRAAAVKEPPSKTADDRLQTAIDADAAGPEAAVPLPDPVEFPAEIEPLSGGPTGEIIDNPEYSNTATIDITEALAGDTVVWDADDLEEEVNMTNATADETGDEYSVQDDVIVFDQPDEPVQTRALGETDDQGPDTTAAAEERRKSTTAESDGNSVNKYFSLGLAASDQKEYLKAIQYFTKVTSLSPKDPRGYYNLAVVSYRLRFYETAREHAKQALTLGSKSARRILEKIDAQQAAA